jgi:hypothetical protein
MSPGPRRRSAFDRSPKEGGLSPRSEGAVDSTKDAGRSRPGQIATIKQPRVSRPVALFPGTNSAVCGKIRTAMAVLHITYTHNPQTSKAGYDGFYKVITTYQYRRLSKSHWTIDTEESPHAVWQKLKQYIDPSDYFLMMPLDPTWFSAKDRTVLSWLAAGP